MNKLKLLIPILTASLVGCFNPSGPSDNKVAKERPDYGITGHAVDGLIKNGDVRVYDFNDGVKGAILGTGKTDSFGVFDASVKGIKSDGQYVLSCVVSGSYVEEASGVQISLEDGQELCAVKYFNPSENFSVVINPWSHYAYALVSYLVTQGEGVENAATEANTTFSSVAGFNNLTTVPYDTTDISVFGKPYDSAMLMGYSIAGISQLVLDIAKETGLTRHTNNFSSMAFHQINFNDIHSDGKWDGKGLAQNGKSIVSLGMGVREFNRYTNNLDLAKATVDFANSDMNKAGVNVQTLLSDLDDLASSTDGVFGDLNGAPVPTLDGDGPVITLNITDNQYVSGTLKLVGNISDFSGVRSLKATIDGNEYNLQPNLGAFQLEYVTSGDGVLDITITATDLLNNTSTFNVSALLANSKPIPSMTSETLVNSDSYDFNATLTNYEQGVKSITVNGITATLDSNSNISAQLDLEQGINELVMIIVDGTDVSHNYTFNVSVDTTLPTLNLLLPNIALNYKTYYKDFGIAEPFLSNLLFDKSGKPFYIDQFHVSLSGQSINEENLKTQNWAYIKFSPIDPSTESNGHVFTPAEELKVSYRYRQGNSEQELKEISAFDIEKNEYIIPLSTEFLIAGWNEYESTQAIDIVIEDNAGMKNSTTFEFSVYDSIPQLDIDVDSSDWFSGNSTLQFDSTDFTGVDSVTLTVNGVVYTSSSLTNPSFDLNLSGLSGLQAGTLRAYKDGVLVYSDNLEISVDNTNAIFSVSSPAYFNNSEYLVTGPVYDNESGINYVQVDGSNASYSLFDNSFTYPLTNLAEGNYSVVITAENNAGLMTQLTHNFGIDLTNPSAFIQYPSLSNPYSIDYQNTLSSSPSLAELQLINDSSVFYYTKDNYSLNGNLATISYLKTKKIPFIKVDISDAYSNGAGTPNTDLTVLADYLVDGQTVYENKALTSADSSYILPLTIEEIGTQFLNNPDAKHQIVLNVKDKAGNIESEYFYFKSIFDPSLSFETPNGYTPFSLTKKQFSDSIKTGAVINKFNYTNTLSTPIEVSLNKKNQTFNLITNKKTGNNVTTYKAVKRPVFTSYRAKEFIKVGNNELLALCELKVEPLRNIVSTADNWIPYYSENITTNSTLPAPVNNGVYSSNPVADYNLTVNKMIFNGGYLCIDETEYNNGFIKPDPRVIDSNTFYSRRVASVKLNVRLRTKFHSNTSISDCTNAGYQYEDDQWAGTSCYIDFSDTQSISVTTINQFSSFAISKNIDVQVSSQDLYPPTTYKDVSSIQYDWGFVYEEIPNSTVFDGSESSTNETINGVISLKINNEIVEYGDKYTIDSGDFVNIQVLLSSDSVVDDSDCIFGYELKTCALGYTINTPNTDVKAQTRHPSSFNYKDVFTANPVLIPEINKVLN